MYIYIYNEKPLQILEMYGLKKVNTNTMYNLNRIIVIIFNYTHAYAQSYTLV